jgi:D-alanyl-D-alanine endopeptidase (penicillin-binding protein 7)
MKNQANTQKTIFAFRQLTQVVVFSLGICALVPLLEESSEARDSSNYTNSNQSNNAVRKRSSAQTKKNARPAKTVRAPKTAPKSPKVAATSAYVSSVPIGNVIFEKDADTVRPVASLSKLMSAIVYLDHCIVSERDGETVTSSKEDLAKMHTMTPLSRMMAKGGDHSQLTTGWDYSRYDLLKAALMRSDNRALPALMESCNLNLQKFVMLMNKKAKDLGLVNTSFSEPTGLSPHNISTAREFSKILIESTRFAILADLMQTRHSTVTGHKNGRTRTFKLLNTNYLLGRRGLDIVAGKTGYTDPARYCFAVVNKDGNNRAVAMVFLGAEGKHTRFGDFSRVLKWMDDEERFAMNQRVRSDSTNHLNEQTDDRSH